MAAIEDVCTACGERNPAGSAFCLYCGVYLGWDEASTADRSSARTSVPAAEATTTSSDPPTRVDPAVSQPTVQRQPTEQPRREQARPTEPPCPQCGHPNATPLRFCGKCGHPLRPSQTTTRARPTPTTQTWWQRFRDPTDRRARRDYRRSLPPLYRWRRVLITLALIIAAVVILTIVGNNPVSWAKDRYYDLRGTLVVPDEVVYTAEPPESAVAGFDVTALGSAPADDAWVIDWPKTFTPVKGCGGQQAAPGMIRLTFTEPVRIRELSVLAGLPPDNARRPLFYRPKTLLVMYGSDQCAALELRDVADAQHLKLDTKDAVGSLTVAIADDAYAGRENGRQPFVAMTTLTPLTRPH